MRSLHFGGNHRPDYAEKGGEPPAVRTRRGSWVVIFLTAFVAASIVPLRAEDSPTPAKPFVPIDLKAAAEKARAEAQAAQPEAPVTAPASASSPDAGASSAPVTSAAAPEAPALLPESAARPSVEPTLPAAALPEAGKALPTPEVRVLIDISGSMKRTDPANLRAPALRLLVGLLPQEAQGGVWFFGDEVRVLLKPAPVTESWRKEALEAAGRITSDKPFTHIGAALETALAGWEPASAASVRRHVILLTDGMVDIGKEEGVNAKARQTILADLMPKAQQRGVRLHTIALSGEADHELLQALARATDGVYERTDDAARLQRIFLRLFEKSAPRDALPMKDNAFNVDGTVSQLTLLVFRAPGAEPTRIVTPDRKVVDAIGADKLSGWRWARDEGHDLITLDRPQPGAYRIQAAADPDNRALILSDLRLNNLPLPNTVYLGERLDWAAWFTEKNELLKDERFHNAVSMKLLTAAEGRPPVEKFIADQGRGGDFVAADGVINQRLGEGLQPGAHLLTLEASSKTFTRLVRHDFDVQDVALVTVETSVSGEGAQRHHRIVARLDTERVRASEASIGGVLDCPPGEPVPVVFGPSKACAADVGAHAEGAASPALNCTTEPFVLDLSPAQSTQACSLKLRLDGRLSNGRPISWPASAKPLPPLPPVEGVAEAAASPSNWPLIAGTVGGANLMGGLMAWGLHSFLRRRRHARVAALLKGFATS
ncbi:MAG: vWA domain-containing protein [Pseudomonadota bacterium]